MRNISKKLETLRIANARSVVRISDISIEAIENNKVPKGNIFEIAKVAGFLAVKNTANVIPHCHPLPVEDCTINFKRIEHDIIIDIGVTSVYKTGVEVEAMYGASVVAITIYDLLKPIDQNIEILSTKLIAKSGGKSSFVQYAEEGFNAAVIVMSDSISKGQKEDRAGKAIIEKLSACNIKNIEYLIIPDDPEKLTKVVKERTEKKMKLIITTGGTGLSPRDITPETLENLFDKKIEGIAEQIRNYGQYRTPYSMLSRSTAGVISETLVIALPGSTKGASESMDAVFPYALHAFHAMEGKRHD